MKIFSTYKVKIKDSHKALSDTVGLYRKVTNDPKEIDNMVGDMFSVRRVNTVHELSSQGKDKSFSK